MTTINLAYPDDTIRIDKFPDGQQNVTILKPPKELDVVIKCRLRNFMDLELLLCTIASLRKITDYNILVYCYYLLGARSDRQFEYGGNNYLVDVIRPLLPKENFFVLAPHNYDLWEKLNGNTIFLPLELQLAPEAKVVLYADKSAEFNSELFPDNYRYTWQKKRFPSFVVEKTRIGSGFEFVVPEIDSDEITIVDDLCDAGGTFIGIAKILKERNPKVKLKLCVTHGIFSKGFATLGQYFEEIYCTNSYSDIGDTYVDSYGNTHPTKVKQIKVI